METTLCVLGSVVKGEARAVSDGTFAPCAGA